MKKIIIAPDSFKESMTAMEACHAIEEGIIKSGNQYQIQMVPMADGGEGTIEAIAQVLPSSFVEVNVQGPLKEKIKAKYLLLPQQNSAVIEVAEACGLNKIEPQDRNPMQTSTYGVGELIKSALEHDVEKIYIGLGGSATNDGGLGLLRALGAKFYDTSGKSIAEVKDLIYLEKMDLSECFHLLQHCQIIVLSDVDNPFVGKDGATYVFGKQKGANQQQLDALESCLQQFNKIVMKQYDMDLAKIKKTGAAGGMGGALYLLGAQMQSGIQTILELTDFATRCKDADYIVTGEGSIDHQTKNGKTISGILKIAKERDIPVIAFAGRVTNDIDALYEAGLTAAFSITNEAKTLVQALDDGYESLAETAENVFRLIG